MSSNKRVLAAAFVVVAIAGGEVSAVQAQPQQVEAPYKGTIGLGLLGAELGMVIPAVAGLHEAWAFVVFPVLGAGAGAVGGYFGLDEGGQTELAVASITAGLVLAIPSLVLTLSATSYDPSEDMPVPEETALLKLDARGARLAPPGLAVRQSHSLREAKRIAVAPQTDLQVSLVAAKF